MPSLMVGEVLDMRQNEVSMQIQSFPLPREAIRKEMRMRTEGHLPFGRCVPELMSGWDLDFWPLTTILQLLLTCTHDS